MKRIMNPENGKESEHTNIFSTSFKALNFFISLFPTVHEPLKINSPLNVPLMNSIICV